MNFTQAIFPGLALTAGIIQLIIAISQLYIFRNSKYNRAKSVMFFTLFSSTFAFQQFIAQSRVFSVSFSLYAALAIFVLISVSRYFYFRSMRYFIAIPDKKYSSYMLSNTCLGIFSVLPLLSCLVGGPELVFDSSTKSSLGNYFADSYSSILGEPVIYGAVLLSVYAMLDIYYGNYLLQRLRRSSRDRWLMVGLITTIVAAFLENLMLPFTLEFYVPVYIFANLFESIRMSFLSVQEYLIESELRGSALQPVDKTALNNPYQNSNLTDEKVRELSEKTRMLLGDMQLYQNSNLRLEKLAHHVGVPSYLMSQVINNGMNTTFNDLVNGYRIEAIKKKLRDEKNVSRNITDIAYETGFNSKSTFFTTFKKVSGTTPAEYRRSAVQRSKKSPMIIEVSQEEPLSSKSKKDPKD